MNLLKTVSVLTVYFIILLFASCTNPVVSEILEIIVPEVVEIIPEVEPEIIPEPMAEPLPGPVEVIIEIELTLYSLTGVQRPETSEPVEVSRIVIDTTEYINYLIEVDGKDYFLFMGDNMFNNFGINIQEMTEEEYNIVIEIVGLFPEMSMNELKVVYL